MVEKNGRMKSVSFVHGEVDEENLNEGFDINKEGLYFGQCKVVVE